MRGIALVALFMVSLAHAESPLLRPFFLEGTVGSIRFNRTADNGYDTNAAFGAGAGYWWNDFGLGLRYQRYQSSDGDAWLKTSDTWDWLQAQLRYRLISDQIIAPYVFLGAGAVFEKVTLSIPGSSISGHSANLSRSAGAGMTSQIFEQMGFGLEGQYHEISNRYGLGLSFFAFYTL